MYREEPDDNVPDSGWRFLMGEEDDDYMDNPENHNIFALNTICNYDPDIIPYLDSPAGTFLIRVSESEFEIDDQRNPIFVQKQINK